MKKILFIVTFFLSGVFVTHVAYSGNMVGDINNDTVIYSVYELSSQITAIVSNMDENAGDPSVFDEIFLALDEQEKFVEDYFDTKYDGEISQNISYKDTTGIFRIVYNKKVEAGIKPLLCDEYFIYGTKGMESLSAKEVFFSLDECLTNFFAFSIENFDKSKNGYPLLASDKKLDLVYGGDYASIEDKINAFYNQSEADYRNNIAAKVYAHSGNMYFTYNDDFGWNGKYRGKDPECLYPDRAIFILKEDGTIELFWYDSLDLYGIACD